MKAVLFAALLCVLSLAAVNSAEQEKPVGVAVFVCNEWQGIVVRIDGKWRQYSAWTIVDDTDIQDLLRGIELEEIRLGERNFCTAFKSA